MPTYVVLGNYTDQGSRKVRQLDQLRQAGEAWDASKNGQVISNYR